MAAAVSTAAAFHMHIDRMPLRRPHTIKL
jgi:hypothetical protein